MRARPKRKSAARPRARRAQPAARITFTVAVTALPGREAVLQSELRRLIRPTRGEPGCIQYLLHRSTEQPGHFLFYEVWASRAALERHWQSRHFLRWKERRPALAGDSTRIVWDPLA